MPKTRRILSGVRSRIELYWFPASRTTGGVDRLASVSDAFNQKSGESGIELLFAWLPLSTHASFESLQDLVFDASVYCEETKYGNEARSLFRAVVPNH